jgi:hypothetical protein
VPDTQQQQQQQQQQQHASPAVPQAANLPAGCRVLLSKALTRSDATAKRIILRCKQVESSLGSRPVGQGHKLTVGLPCGSSCSVMVRAWANGSNAKPMYVLEQVDQLFRQQQLVAGDTVSLLVSGDGSQHFLCWQRAGEAAEQLAAAAAEPAAAVSAVAAQPKPVEPVAAAPVHVVAAVPAAAVAPAVVVEAATATPAAKAPAEPTGQQSGQLKQKKLKLKKRQHQLVVPAVQAAEPAQQQSQLVVQPQPVQPQLVVSQPAEPVQQQQQQQREVQPQLLAADRQQHVVEQQQDDQDAALLLLPLVGSSMDCALRTGCYLLCLQQGCVQPACLGCMGCALHKRRRVA